MTMKIHASDGQIEFARGSVSVMTDKESFLASPLGDSARVIVENGPYVTYQVTPESGIGATLLFKGGQLKNVAWAIQMPHESESTWSEESEVQRKELHDSWLLKELGKPPYQFRWGQIVSEYDAKGVSSAIIVVYDR
jgi:hypothetical protein